MIFDDSTTYFDKKLGRLEKVFGGQPTEYMPVIDSAAKAVAQGTAILDPGMTEVSGLLESAMMNTASAMRMAALSTARSIGFTELGEVASDVASLVRIDSVAKSAAIAARIRSGELSTENGVDQMWASAGRDILDVVAAVPLVGIVVNLGRMVAGVASSTAEMIKGNPGRAALPFVGQDGSDTAAVIEIRKLIQSGDVTRIFMPRHAGRYVTGPRKNPPVMGLAIYRSTTGGEVPTPANGLGVLPGMGMTSVIEVRFPPVWSRRGAGDPERLYYRTQCTYKSKACLEKKSSFDGKRDCRQCVDPWDGRDQGLMSAGERPVATDVGMTYTSVAAAAAQVWAQCMTIGPTIWSASAARIASAWEEAADEFDEFIDRQWQIGSGAWRINIAQAASLMLVGGQHEIGEQWIKADKTTIRMPSIVDAFRANGLDVRKTKLRAAAEIALNLARMQSDAVRTTAIAMGSRRSGAFPTAADRETHDKAFKDLLTSSVRFSVNLNDVTDPEKKKALIDSGVVQVAVHGPKTIGTGVGQEIGGWNGGRTGVFRLESAPPARAPVSIPPARMVTVRADGSLYGMSGRTKAIMALSIISTVAAISATAIKKGRQRR